MCTRQLSGQHWLGLGRRSRLEDILGNMGLCAILLWVGMLVG